MHGLAFFKFSKFLSLSKKFHIQIWLEIELRTYQMRVHCLTMRLPIPFIQYNCGEEYYIFVGKSLKQSHSWTGFADYDLWTTVLYRCIYLPGSCLYKIHFEQTVKNLYKTVALLRARWSCSEMLPLDSIHCILWCS